MARGKKKETSLTPEEKLAQALVPDWEQPYKVPKNWCWVKLSALSSLISKGTTPTGGKNAYVPEGIHFLRVENINDDGTISHNDIACVTEEMHTGFLKRSMLENRDVLISIAGTLGKTGIVRDVDLPLNTNQAVAFVRLKNETINERYIKGVIDNPIAQELLLGKTKVTSIPNLTLEIIGDCPIPLAPAAEQQRIVDRIEYLFAKLDEAREKAQSVLDSFETRKAAILHKAFTGELTAKWRAEHGVVIGSWEHVLYCEIGTSKLGKMLDKAKNVGVSTPYLRNVNVRWFSFDLSDVYFMPASTAEIESLSVKPGDLFICEGGEPGRCAVWKEPNSELIFQKALHRFRPNGKVISEFLCYNLYYMSLNGGLEQYFTGTTIKHLTGQSLAKIPLSLPSITEQREIVRILDSLFSKEQQAKEAAEAVLERIDLLKKSILSRAFRGELGTNDPAEESALELLKRIL